MTTQTKSEFRSYIDQFGTLPQDVTLGYIAWYSVQDGEYDATAMAAEFARLGLSPKFLPAQINPADAFEKASKSLDNTRYRLNPTNVAGAGDHYAVILMREAARDKTKIVRKAIREIRDSKNAVLQYDEVAEFYFYKPVTRGGKVDYTSFRVRPSITATPVSMLEHQAWQQMMDDFRAQMDRHLAYHDGQKMRSVIRDYLLYLNAISMKDSVYFIHNSRASELLALREFCASFGLAKTSLTLVPLPDLPSLRTDVVDAFQREAFNDLMGIKDRIDKLRANRTGPISPAAYLKVQAEYDDVLRKATEYSRVLDVVQDTTSAAAMVALQAVSDLGAEVAAALTGGS